MDSKLEVTILHGCLSGVNCILNPPHCNIILDSCGAEWSNFCENLSQIVDPSCSIESKNDKRGAKIKRRQFQRGITFCLTAEWDF